MVRGGGGGGEEGGSGGGGRGDCVCSMRGVWLWQGLL